MKGVRKFTLKTHKIKNCEEFIQLLINEIYKRDEEICEYIFKYETQKELEKYKLPEDMISCIERKLYKWIEKKLKKYSNTLKFEISEFFIEIELCNDYVIEEHLDKIEEIKVEYEIPTSDEYYNTIKFKIKLITKDGKVINREISGYYTMCYYDYCYIPSVEIIEDEISLNSYSGGSVTTEWVNSGYKIIGECPDNNNINMKCEYNSEGKGATYYTEYKCTVDIPYRKALIVYEYSNNYINETSYGNVIIYIKK